MAEANNHPDDLVTFAVGDIHGCLNKLERLLDICGRYGGARPTRFVFLGDYVDRGPDSRGVIEKLREMQRNGGGEVICLRGNHEELMLRAVQSNDIEPWLLNGGSYTLASYRIEDAQSLPPEAIEWVASLPFSFDDGQHYFVHAGVNPLRPLDAQNERDRTWIREPFLSSKRDYGRLVVHGHTPVMQGIPDLRRNRLNLDTAAVMGGPLTAAAFIGRKVVPTAFLNDRGVISVTRDDFAAAPE